MRLRAAAPAACRCGPLPRAPRDRRSRTASARTGARRRRRRQARNLVVLVIAIDADQPSLRTSASRPRTGDPGRYRDSARASAARCAVARPPAQARRARSRRFRTPRAGARRRGTVACASVQVSQLDSRPPGHSTSIRASSSLRASGIPVSESPADDPGGGTRRNGESSGARSSSRHGCSRAAVARRAGSSSPTTPRTPRKRRGRSSGSTSAATSSAHSGSSAPPRSRRYYLSLTFDRGVKKPLYMFTTQGGIDIEEVAERTPEALVKLHVDPLEGFSPGRPGLTSTAPGSGFGRAEADRHDRGQALRRLRRHGRDAVRDQPAHRHAGRRGQGARLPVPRSTKTRSTSTRRSRRCGTSPQPTPSRHWRGRKA